MRYPTRFQQRTLWNAATGLSILILGALLVGLIWLVSTIFGFLQPVLIPLLVAGIIAYVLEPVVTLLEKRGLSRFWSVIVLFLTVLIAATLLTVAIIPGLQRGHGTLKRFIEKAMPHQVEHVREGEATQGEESKRLGNALEEKLRELDAASQGNLIGWLLEEKEPAKSLEKTPLSTQDENLPPETIRKPELRTLESFAQSRAGRMLFEYKGAIFKTGRQWLMTGSSRIIGFLGLVLGMIMVPIYLFFFLKDSASIRAHWHDYVPLKSGRFKTELVETLREINGYLISYFRGQVLVAAIDGILVGIALSIFGLPYGFLIGIFMAILGVIPYIGNILCLIPACIIAYLHAQTETPFNMAPWMYVSCVVLIFIVVQQINSLVTAPKIVGDSVGLHPLTVIFSMLLWSLALGGFAGALMAVPLTAAIKVLFRRFIWERRLKEAQLFENGAPGVSPAPSAAPPEILPPAL